MCCQVKVIILEASGVNAIDATGVHMIEEFAQECKRRDIKLLFSMVKRAVMDSLLRSVGICRLVCSRPTCARVPCKVWTASGLRMA